MGKHTGQIDDTTRPAAIGRHDLRQAIAKRLLSTISIETSPSCHLECQLHGGSLSRQVLQMADTPAVAPAGAGATRRRTCATGQDSLPIGSAGCGNLDARTGRPQDLSGLRRYLHTAAASSRTARQEPDRKVASFAPHPRMWKWCVSILPNFRWILRPADCSFRPFPLELQGNGAIRSDAIDTSTQSVCMAHSDSGDLQPHGSLLLQDRYLRSASW